MSLGTRFRTSPGTTSSLRTTVGAAVIGAALLGGSLGLAGAQDASPEASPMAVLGEEPVINVAEIEVRPYIILQTDNQTEAVQNVAVFAVPADYDATTFAFPASEADLPEGVTAVGGYQVAPGEQYAAVFDGSLVEGTYVVATDGGMTIPFAVTPMAEIDVPDVFASPEA